MSPQLRFGTFGLPWTFWNASLGIFVFRHTVAGNDYDVAVRFRPIGCQIIDSGIDVPGRVTNSALAAADTYGVGLVTVVGATYPLEIAVTFPANELVLTGMGRATFYDGDALATGIHAIVMDGVTDCVVKDLSIQTQDGGGKVCHNLLIQNGAHRFRIENVIFVESDSDAIRVTGTTINEGHIINCNILDADGYGIYIDAPAANAIYEIEIINNYLACSGNDGIYLRRAYDLIIHGNYIHDVATGYGIHAQPTVARLHIYNNVLRTIGHNGIELNGLVGLSEIKDNYIEDVGNTTAGSAIHLITVVNCVIVTNYLDSHSTYTIHLEESCHRVEILGNYSEGGNNTSHIIYLQAPVAIANIEYIVVQDNYLDGGPADGIHLTDRTRRSTIQGNYIFAMGGTLGNGITLYDDHNLINDNYIHEIENGHGIYCDGGGLNIIANNHLYNCGYDDPGVYHGIYLLNGANFNKVSGNFVDGNNSTEDLILVIGNYCQITDNYGWNGAGCGISVNGNYNLIEVNYMRSHDDYGLEIVGGIENMAMTNYYLGNGLGAIIDGGTDTKLPELNFRVTDPDGNIGTHPCIVLTDGVPVTVRFELDIPMKFQELVRARVVLVPGGTGNLRRIVATNWGKICASEDYNVHTDAIAAGQVAVTINDLECIDIIAAFTGIAPGDTVGLEFTREGENALDTVGADCYLIKVNMQYV